MAMPDPSGVTADQVDVTAPRIPTLSDISPEAAKRLDETASRRSAMYDEESRITAQGAQLARDRESALAPFRESLKQSISSPLPDMPRLEDAPQPPSDKIIEPDDFKKFAQVAFPFVLLLGKAMRADGVQALNALSSGVQGYMQGRQQESQQQFKTFQAKMQQVTQSNQQKIQSYREIMQRRDMDMQQKLTLLNIEAQKYDDQATQLAVQRKSVGEVLKHLDQEDAATMKMANASVQISKQIEDNFTKRQHYHAMEQIAQQRIQKMGTLGKTDAQTAKKRDWLQKQQMDLFKTFATRLSALTSKQMPESQRKLAETQLRNWYAESTKYLNDIGRGEGFAVPPELAAMENPANDPLGPSSTPKSAAEQQSWMQGITNAWRNMFGTQPGVNPGVTPPKPPAGAPAAPAPPAGDVVDFNSLPQ